jgi:amino-acid N-acetyltransferase
MKQSKSSPWQPPLRGTLWDAVLLHVFWENLGEIRTLAVSPDHLGEGIGTALVGALEEQARELGLDTLFCLTFEVEFFRRNGFHLQDDQIVDPEIYRGVGALAR